MARKERRFQRVCDQLVLMNNNLWAVNVRYEPAKRSNRSTMGYNLRIRILSIEGVRNMFFEYAEEMAERLEEMEIELLERYGIDWLDIRRLLMRPWLRRPLTCNTPTIHPSY